MIDETIETAEAAPANVDAGRVIPKTQCGGCKRYFTGNGVFDTHRLGPFQQRRCMTDEELAAAVIEKELCLVRVMRENHSFSELHEVWFDVAERQRMNVRRERGQIGKEASASPLDGG